MNIFQFAAWFWGDPHIRTLDGLLYTYNGVGEYWMVFSDSFKMQTRTIQGKNTDGELIKATVVGAAALEIVDDQPSVVNNSVVTTTVKTRIQVELTEDGQGKTVTKLESFFYNYVCFFRPYNSLEWS